MTYRMFRSGLPIIVSLIARRAMPFRSMWPRSTNQYNHVDDGPTSRLVGKSIMGNQLLSDHCNRFTRLLAQSSSMDLIAAAVLAAVLAALFWRCIIYPVLLSPLAAVPAAHPLAHVTSLWINWQRFRGVEFDKVTAALAAKGPYVRLGPRELVVNDIDAVHGAWGVGPANFDKHSSYRFFMTHGCVPCGGEG